MESRVINEVSSLLEKADQSVSAAIHLLGGGFYGDAVSKSYYAMLHAAQALLAKHTINRSKHSAVIAAVGQYFVKTGYLSPQCHQYLINAFEDRESADYNIAWLATEEEARTHLDHAGKFIDQVKKLIAQDLKIEAKRPTRENKNPPGCRFT